MDVATSRFAELVGPHCLARDCLTDVIMCDGVATLFDADPIDEGIYRLTDTGGEKPFAAITTVAQRFGKRGQLHRRHETYCLKAKRIKKR
jgi:hypothetical protein